MGRLKTITRRAFLIGSVAVTGGVAFGAYMVGRDPENPLLAGLSDGEAAITPFVKITSEGVTLITPHADVGQGVYHAQALLIAEEMDLELGQFEVSPGEPSAAYWNTAMAEEAVPFKSTDEGFAAETMRSVMGGVFKVFGVQGTGGSSSMPDSFVKLREAGAVARETLKAAASARTGVPVGDLTTASGEVRLPDGTAIAYSDLASDAAGIEPVRTVALRDPSEWRLVGKPTQRLDIVGKSTGTTPYGIDLQIPGMVHATVKMNPRRGPINGYDASAAENMRGVEKIIPVRNGVAVVASNTWYAIQAANAIEFDWGASPYPPEQDQHWAEVDASFTEERLNMEWRHDGDVDASLDGAEVISAEYRAPYLAHQPLEPLNAVVRVDENGAEVWANHQLPTFLKMQVAGVAGIEADQVTFHNQYGGGSFGHRLEFENITLATEIAVQMPGVPVKLTYSREEDFCQDFGRQIGAARAKGVVKDGKVEAFDLQIATTSAVASQGGRMGLPFGGPDTQISAGAWNNPYDIPNQRHRAYLVPELAPVSSWRSVGASGAGFFNEGPLDEMILAAGGDPLEERIRMCTHTDSRKVLEAVGEMSGWGSDLGPNRGRGVAFVNSFGVPTAEVIEVTMTDWGIKIDKVFVALDVGTIIDPDNFENHVQGGVVFALGHAINSELTYSDGIAEQTNYHAAEGMRLYQTPEVHVRGLENAEKIRGVGEPPIPPAAPALANAIYAATGQRLREMPFNKFIDFV